MSTNAKHTVTLAEDTELNDIVSLGTSACEICSWCQENHKLNLRVFISLAFPSPFPTSFYFILFFYSCVGICLCLYIHRCVCVCTCVGHSASISTYSLRQSSLPELEACVFSTRLEACNSPGSFCLHPLWCWSNRLSGDSWLTMWVLESKLQPLCLHSKLS